MPSVQDSALGGKPPLVYVAGPFSAPDRAGVEANIQQAVNFGIGLAKIGAFPVVPHANTAHPDYETVQPYSFWIAGTMALLRVCNAVLLIPGWRDSSGARGERAEAERLVIPCFETLSDVHRWMRDVWSVA